MADYNVIIIGAGISGIDMAYRLQEASPQCKYTILESKSSLGGTWEQFRFPGVRSDSDLYTFGFPFKPWTNRKSIASGGAILDYLNETVRDFGIDKHIRYDTKVSSAKWSTATKLWTIEADGVSTMHAPFVVFCTGYFDHDHALSTSIPGIDNFKGQIVHPQFWPEDLGYAGKNIVIIGSGATAITLLPELAKTANVVQLQRSPTYVVSQEQESPLNKLLRAVLPTMLAYKMIRLTSFLLPHLFFRFATAFPNLARTFIRSEAAKQLPTNYDMSHFEPKYDPWSQRLCVCPEGDYYAAVKAGAEIITSTIDKITQDSIILPDRTLHPDIIITATGLRVRVAGGVRIEVDKQPLNMADKFMYRGAMLQDLPNAAVSVGYTNASWTLGADVAAHFVVRLMRHMQKNDLLQCTPRAPLMKERPLLNLNSTYVTKAKGDLPKAGDRGPWLPKSMYLLDLWDAKHGDYRDLEFS